MSHDLCNINDIMKTLKHTLTLFILLFGVALVADAKPVKAKVRSVEGPVEFAMPDSNQFKPLRPGMLLSAGSKVRSGPGAEAIITVTPGAALRVAENTEVTLDEMAFDQAGSKVTERKARIDLTSGTVSTLIDKGDPEVTDFKIKTPQGSAAARGTFYGVTVKDGQTYVKVEEGKVGFQKAE